MEFSLSIDGFVTVSDVQEEVFFTIFLVERADSCRGWRNDVVYEKEQCILGPELDTFTDQKVKLSNSQVRGYEILLFVEIANSGIGGLFNNYLYRVETKMRNISMCKKLNK